VSRARRRSAVSRRLKQAPQADVPYFASSPLFADEFLHELYYSLSNLFVGTCKVFTGRRHIVPLEDSSGRCRQTSQVATY
jgi:hypothetical protein